MKNRILYRPAYLMLAAGLLVGAIAQFITQFTSLPDFAKGAFFGVGIGIELAALIKIIRTKASLTSRK